MRYRSPGDEAAFFGWLQSIPGVLSVQCRGRELHIQLRSSRLSQASLRELVALYQPYGGHLPELARFETDANCAWFRNKKADWFTGVFGQLKSV